MTRLFALLLLALLLLPMYAGMRRMRNLPKRPPAGTTGHGGPGPGSLRDDTQADRPDHVAADAHGS